MKLSPEKTKVIFMWIIAIATFLMVSLGACDYLYKKYDIPHDNSAEELLEKMIEEQLDFPEGSLDFTPASEEMSEER